MSYRLTSMLGYCALGAAMGCAHPADEPLAVDSRDCSDDACIRQRDTHADAGAPGIMTTMDSVHAEDGDAAAPAHESPLGREVGYGFVPGEPFALPAPEQGFVFVPIEGSMCQDGSSTGIAVQRGTDDVLIYLEAGGACFNDWTCLTSSTLFASRSFGEADLGRIPKQGIFSDAADNPVRAWTKIFVGYCSGDVFSGVAADGSGYDGQSQTGFENMRLALARVAPSFPSAKRVLLAGSSAGAFGSLVNWVQAQEAFGHVPVDVLADSGPMVSDAYLAPCLQNTWRKLWRWDETVPPGCAACQHPTGGTVDPMFTYLLTHFPKTRFGLMSYTQDTVIRLFFGAGEQECGTLIPSPTNYPGPRYTEALLDLRARFADAENFSTFYVQGTNHTFLVTDPSVSASGQSVFAWLSAFLEGRAGHAGP